MDIEKTLRNLIDFSVKHYVIRMMGHDYEPDTEEYKDVYDALTKFCTNEIIVAKED